MDYSSYIEVVKLLAIGTLPRHTPAAPGTEVRTARGHGAAKWPDSLTLSDSLSKFWSHC